MCVIKIEWMCMLCESTVLCGCVLVFYMGYDLYCGYNVVWGCNCFVGVSLSVWWGVFG